MSWEVGYDTRWQRDIGYGVPAICDHPGCGSEIHRGLSYVCCDGHPEGGDRGCGLYFCPDHQHTTENHSQLCGRCLRGNKPFAPTSDTREWIGHKLADASWAAWREQNPQWVAEHADMYPIATFRPGDPPPTSYLAWHEWAEVQQMAGLKQMQCVRCGLWRYPQEFSTTTSICLKCAFVE